MSSLYVDADEWYPVYSLTDRATWPGQPPAEITDKDHADYLRVMREFEAWQQRLSGMEGLP